jgi:hypothetical protein
MMSLPPFRKTIKRPIDCRKNALLLSHLVRDKDIGYRHGGVNTPQSKQIIQNAL